MEHVWGKSVCFFYQHCSDSDFRLVRIGGDEVLGSSPTCRNTFLIKINPKVHVIDMKSRRGIKERLRFSAMFVLCNP